MHARPRSPAPGLYRKALFLLLAMAVPGVVPPELAAGPPRSEKFRAEAKEPPARDFDFEHLRLECSFDWDRESVDARVAHRARALREGVRRVRLDAVGIDVQEVRSAGGQRLECETYPEALAVDLGRACRRGEEVAFTIEYRARPRQGIYFFKPDASDPGAPRQLWSQGECREARHWIPCFDHPADKVTTEVLVRAPKPLVGLSNGRLVETREVGEDRIFHWLQDKPHATYLVSVVAGEFATWTDSWQGVPLAAYVPQGEEGKAARSFGRTADMLEFFSSRTGYPYPWDRYDQICVHEFLFGGMENTSVTTLTASTLRDERAALDGDSTGLVAHELAHQWFGDLVTCRDWAHIWLNESFATFWENLYREARDGRDEALYERYEQARSYKDEDRKNYRRPLVVRTYRRPEDLFDRHAYPKGARILNMLRYVLGDEAFFAGIKHYLGRHAFQSVETAQFRLALEESSGQSLRWFFDQWVHAGGHPEYRVSARWDHEARVLRVVVEQVQEVDDLTPLFRMPVVIQVVAPSGSAEHRVWIAERKETFQLPLAERPRLVRFDPSDWILKDLEFPKSREELLYQLEHDTDMMGRLVAARELEHHRDAEPVEEVLLRRLREEPFWGVRKEIAAALGSFDPGAVAGGLVAALAVEEKAAVRVAILAALGELGAGAAAEAARKAFREDPSYEVAARALRVLDKLEGKQAREEVFQALERESHGEVIRAAALEILGALDEPGEEERRSLVARVLPLAAPGRPRGLREAAFRALARLGKGSDEVFDLLAQGLEARSFWVRWAAIEALGELGERRAVALLEKRRREEAGTIFRDAHGHIDGAIARIEGREEVKGLGEEVSRLRRGQEEILRRLGELEEVRGSVSHTRTEGDRS